MSVQVKDLSDAQMIWAIDNARDFGVFPYDLLPFFPEKVVMRKMEQMDGRGLIEWGVSLRTAWVIWCEDCGAIGHYFCDGSKRGVKREQVSAERQLERLERMVNRL